MENISYIINNLLQQKDSDRLFLFKEVSNNNIGKTVTALSNIRGGDIIVGIDDKRNILGVTNPDSLINEISSLIIGHVHPTPAFNIYNISYEGKDVIMISVWQGALPPYSLDDAFYCLKAGGLVCKANLSELELLFANRKTIDESWERQLSSASVEDINLSLVTDTMHKNNSTDKPSDDCVEFLMRKGLFRQGLATNGCVVLFGNNPTQFIPQAMIRLSIYDEKNELIQTLRFEDCLLDTIPHLFEKLKNLYWSEVVIEGLSRMEKKSYPEIAIREAILNAMIHRVYNTQTSFLNINLYANRIEISNYGSLPDGIKAADLKKNHLSILRNPDIANICFLNKYIEMAGSGTLRILKDCKDNGFVEPKWTCGGQYVKITFPGVMMRQPSQSKVSLTDAFLSNMSADKRADLLKIVDFVKANPNSKISDIATVVDKSTATIKRYVAELQSFALITYVGGKKYGGYVVVDRDDR